MELRVLSIAILLSGALLAETIEEAGVDKIPKEQQASLGDEAPLKSSNREGYMPNIIVADSDKSGIYGGLGLGAVNLDAALKDGSNTYKSTLMTISLLAGYNFNEYLAAESRASVSIAGGSGSLDYKSIAVYLKPQYSVSEDLSLYSLLGFGKVSTNTILSSDTDSSKATVHLGIGADYKLPNNFKVFADYTYLGKDNSAQFKNKPSTMKASAFTSGITYDF